MKLATTSRTPGRAADKRAKAGGINALRAPPTWATFRVREGWGTMEATIPVTPSVPTMMVSTVRPSSSTATAEQMPVSMKCR